MKRPKQADGAPKANNKGNNTGDEKEAGLSGVRAVDRAIAILQAFTSDKPAMSVIELQQRVGLSRPTLYRLLNTLVARGLIRSEGDPQRFKLAHGIMQLSHVWLKGLDVTGIARPVIESLRDTTGETAALFALHGDRRVCVLEYESRKELSIVRGIGETMTITKGATGRAILAFLDDDRKDALLAGIAKADRGPKLDRALSETRDRGYATSFGEIIVGAVAVAAPYYDHRGVVAGSVGLYGPSARIADGQVAALGGMVIAASREVSILLGYSGDAFVTNSASKLKALRA